MSLQKYERPYDMVMTPDGPVARIRGRGNAALSTPMINRGTRAPGPMR